MDRNEIRGAVVDAAMKVHSTLGPGRLESAYGACLRHELIKRGFKVASEVPVRVIYDGIKESLKLEPKPSEPELAPLS